MEVSNQQTPRAKQRGWLVLLLAFAAAFLAVVFPLALIIAPALWAYAGARTKPALMLLPAALYMAAMFTLESLAVAGGLSGAALICAVLVYVLLTNRFGNADTALVLSGVFLIGLYTVICLPGILDGRGAFADIQAAMSSLRAFYAAAAAQVPQVSAEAVSAVLDTMDLIHDSVPVGFVAVLCVFASVLGLGNLLFFRALCKKQEQIRLSPMRAFRDWTMPRSMMMGLFMMLIVSLILEFSEWTFAASFSVTVNTLLAIPLFLQGISVVDFFIVRAQRNITTMRTLTYVAIGILYQFVLYPLVLVGCIDQIFRLRERMRGIPPRAAV